MWYPVVINLHSSADPSAGGGVVCVASWLGATVSDPSSLPQPASVVRVCAGRRDGPLRIVSTPRHPPTMDYLSAAFNTDEFKDFKEFTR